MPLRQSVPVQRTAVREVNAARPEVPPSAAREAARARSEESIMSELQRVRSLLEEQLAVLAWSDVQRRAPAKSKTLGMMLRAGFSPSLSRLVAEALPASVAGSNEIASAARDVLSRELHIEPCDSMVEKGGVYALVGPTGVGKTTTTAKLAARAVMRYGPSRVALITTDSYRIAGHEQLRIYGKLLGLPVRVAKDADDLALTLAELKGRHLVLIDTVGMGQRDGMVAEQITMLKRCGGDVKRVLLLNSTGNGETLDDVVRAYYGDGLHGCILTKVDEAACLGTVVDTIVRWQLDLHYIADGQRVPEDLHVAQAAQLLERAIAPAAPEASCFDIRDAECAALMVGVPLDAARFPAAHVMRRKARGMGALHA
jgi:flagellar biosynthesis protein FlhF